MGRTTLETTPGAACVASPVL
ncbi:hypothetical protein FAGKG844_360021 [Frankia sp. AgKG'84/4]